MVHWASEKFDEFEDTITGTGWSFEEPSSDNGPVIFTHSDGSELSFVSSSITGGFAIEYMSGDGVSEAIKEDTDGHTSWAEIDNAVEWVVHTLERHEKVN